MRSIIKACASFFVKTQVEASNESKFIVKRVMSIMSILNNEPINVRHLELEILNTWLRHHNEHVVIFV